MDLRDVKNEEFREAFKKRRQMDQTQFSVGNEVIKDGVLTHFRKQGLAESMKKQRAMPFIKKQAIKSSDNVMNSFEELFNENKEITGKHMRKSKLLDDLSVIEVLKHDDD